MKLLLSFFAVLFSFNAYADDHNDSGPFYAFYHLQVANPAALIDSMDRFWASDCGKQYPADVALSQEVFNGSYPSTHFIINTFQNSADQAKAAQLMRSCPAGIEFLTELAQAGTVPTTQYMGAAPIDANDWTQDTVRHHCRTSRSSCLCSRLQRDDDDCFKRHRPSFLWPRGDIFWSRSIHSLGLDRREIDSRAQYN